MAKTKKISVTTMDKMVKAYDNFVESQAVGDTPLIIKKTLSLREVLEFVDAVVESCFQENMGYMPELKEFAIMKNIVEKYTNVSLPEDTEHQYEVLSKSGIIEDVLPQIDRKQYHSMLDAIDEKIKARVKLMSDEYNNKLRNVVDSFVKMTEEMSKMFGNINPEDVQSLLSGLSGGIDESKLMQAFMASKAEGAE